MCFTCYCEQGRHDIGAGHAIETCNPLRLCGASAASHEVGARNAIESFSTKQALEVLRGPLVTILARLKMGLVRITSWYPNFNGSHLGLPPVPSEIHRVTGLPPKIV